MYIGNLKKHISCLIYVKLLGNQEKAVLRNKGAASINTWTEKKGHCLQVIAGTLVQTECIKKYIKSKASNVPPQADSEKRLNILSTGGFYFRLNCFLCARFVTNREKQSGKVHMVQCKNKEVNRVTADVISSQQKDEWSLRVKGQVNFVKNLYKEDAIYHRHCNSHLQSGKKP